MRFALDASVALAWFLPGETEAARDYALRVLEVARAELAFAVVPLLWHEEVADVLLRRRRAKALTRARFDEAIELLRTLPVETHINAYAIDILVPRAERYGLAAYDAVYFDLAAALGLPIATLDAGMRAAARRHGVALFEP